MNNSLGPEMLEGIPTTDVKIYGSDSCKDKCEDCSGKKKTSWEITLVCSHIFHNNVQNLKEVELVQENEREHLQLQFCISSFPLRHSCKIQLKSWFKERLSRH